MADDNFYNTQEILKLLSLDKIGADRFVGQSHFMGSPNVFGGQVVGQSLYAASMTVQNRRPHSLHSLFILPGNYQIPIEFEVERVRDGGSFSTRRVVAVQEGKRIFVMSASFQDPEAGLSHQQPMPTVPDPQTLPSSVGSWQQRNAENARPSMPVPVDFKLVGNGDLFTNKLVGTGKQIWTCAPVRLVDDPLIHEALFAYVSDYGLLWTSLQPHGIGIADKRLQIASLDHTIWFHRPFRMDSWLLFVMTSPNASGGRGLNFAHVYDQTGALVATVAQEGLIRIRDNQL